MTQEGRPSVRQALLFVVLLVNQSTSCRYLPPTPGQATARAARKFCHLLEKAHKAGLSNQSLYIDVGVDGGMEVLIAHAYGHPVVAFECRLQGPRCERVYQQAILDAERRNTAAKLSSPGARLRLESEGPGTLGTLSRALDSSTVHGEQSIESSSQARQCNRARDGGTSATIDSNSQSDPCLAHVERSRVAFQPVCFRIWCPHCPVQANSHPAFPPRRAAPALAYGGC